MGQGEGRGQKSSRKKKRKCVPWPFASRAAPWLRGRGRGQSGELAAEGQGREGGGEVRAEDDRRKWAGPGNKHAETTPGGSSKYSWH